MCSTKGMTPHAMRQFAHEEKASHKLLLVDIRFFASQNTSSYELPRKGLIEKGFLLEKGFTAQAQNRTEQQGKGYMKKLELRYFSVPSL